jgi:hypothetical protein
VSEYLFFLFFCILFCPVKKMLLFSAVRLQLQQPGLLSKALHVHPDIVWAGGLVGWWAGRLVGWWAGGLVGW